MADLQSILNTALNLVKATNFLGQTYLSVQGAKNAANLTSSTVVLNGPGRLAAVSVVALGNATGTVYDSNSLTALTRPIYTIGNVTGITHANLPVSYGIVVAPGSGQAVTVSYSPIPSPT